MKRLWTAAFAALMLLAAHGASADERTVILKVDNLFCATCPYIVKQVLSRVPGVTEVEVSYQEKTAVVTFDDRTTDLAALLAATAGTGFPATVIE
jgi:mercuric ion binding protein